MEREGMTFVSLAAVLLTFFIYLNSRAKPPQEQLQHADAPRIQALALPLDTLFTTDISLRVDALPLLTAFAERLKFSKETIVIEVNAPAHWARTVDDGWQTSLLASQELTRFFLDYGITQERCQVIAHAILDASTANVRLTPLPAQTTTLQRIAA